MGKLVTLFRTFFYSFKLNSKTISLRVYGSANIVRPKNFSFKDGLRINHNCYINASGGIDVGKNVTLSAGSMLLSSGIDLDKFKVDCRSQDYHSYSHVCLGDNIWIGAGAIILPGVSLLGSNVIVGAGTVVTKSFTESNIIIAGNPATIIKHI